ncbi:MAG: hypothetical protein IJ075_01800 [Lachnospiraceae bacterium]|nr:hypothetical protein [Lachnospiraceae bacterium]MBQ9606039.1 hypothetical protein [Lachnospiraceae bacterium]MBR1524090.1 hypothetical protein [Lachnospiraceae bacterium]
MEPIKSIKATINTSFDSIIKFDPKKESYDVEVPSDCFGVLLRIEYDPEYYIRVTADRDAGRFGYAELDTEMGDYLAGSEVPYYEYYDGYIVRLDKREACFDEDLNVTVRIEASNMYDSGRAYEIHLKRRSDREIRDLFKEDNFYDGEYEINMPYELYVPSGYSKKKKYPLVIGLHGTGEREEHVSAILKKMQMATVWAEDSEKGKNECLVLAPQCTIRYDGEDNWTTLNQFIAGHSDSPFWPMPQLTVLWRLIGKLKKDYSIDDKRIYLIGVSSGAFGAYVMAIEHPKAFAGLVTACGAANPARASELKGTPMWIFHSDDDPLIVPAYTLDPTIKALDEAGVKYKLTRYPKGQIFWQSAHFCWEAVFKDEKMRDWLFSQRIGGWDSVVKKVKKTPAKKGSHKISKETSEMAAKAIASAGKIKDIERHYK